MTLLPAMPAIPSLVSRVVASDRLRRLKEISLRLSSLASNYIFSVFSYHEAYGVALTYSAVYSGAYWAHRQLLRDSGWKIIFDEYISEHVI